MKTLSIVIVLIGFLSHSGCAARQSSNFAFPPGLYPAPNVPVVPQSESVLPYTSLPNNGEGSYY